ncbi:CHAT domain-containing protein [Roseofilum sp. BLCC_M154]|uniref:CHAT domain-containing protein n=1 Tax=Roseofilum acuticapitatum BLCC-M154 TaxID=3022444 RepID=A0ABT7AU00_9CYAN|nr:tetratricopeptide repeat protein [Roseofilum acuticapitatum]MDJ1170369.1 CHAT domain-containing protein [Roseofilum acuticapitatum BLCC-M154]
MGKLVVLELEGSLSTEGFRVRLQIGEDGQRPDLDISGYLPSEPDLAQLLESHWVDKYRPLGLPNRGIKPKGIKYDGVLNRIKECKESGDRLCDRLNQWLSSPDFRAIDTQIRERLDYRDRIRFIVRTDCNDLHKLPWHNWQLLSRYTHAEISFSDTNFRRSDPLSTTPPGKVKILAILGHKEGIDTDKDQEILDSLPNAEVTFLIEPKQADINAQLWEQPWDILFFAGHSETDGDTGKIYINPDQYLTVDQIWYGLRKAVAQGLKLAIFNSCDGLGLARKLDDPHIPQMIVMRDYVPDLVAQKFLKSFLVNFSQGYSFEVAVREAREKLQGLEDQIPCATWLPVIWQHPDYISPTWDELVGQSKPKWSFVSWKSYKIPKAIILATCLGLSTYFWIRPKIATYLNRVGVDYIRKDQYHRSLPYLQSALIVYPQQASAINNLGSIYERWGENDLALTMYRRAKRLGDAWGCKGEALIYMKDNKFERASQLQRVCLQQILASETKSPLGEYLIRKDLGISLLRKESFSAMKQQDYLEAERHLRIAIDIKPQEGVANCVLAQVLEAQGESNKALEQWYFCVQFAQDEYPDEAEWIKMGKMRLEESGED